MNVSDLYLIIRELREITILQSNMLEIFAAEGEQAPLYLEQKKVYARLKELLSNYEKYNI
jgi:hypothetical protein